MQGTASSNFNTYQALEASEKRNGCKHLLDASSLFREENPKGMVSEEAFGLAKELLKELTLLEYEIATKRQYGGDFTLQNEILLEKMTLFKHCVPQSHEFLRNIADEFWGIRSEKLNNTNQ